MFSRNRARHPALWLALLVTAGPAFAQISITTFGSPATENFNTLAITGTLVLVIIYVFLGNMRAAIIPALTVPVCLLGAMILLIATDTQGKVVLMTPAAENITGWSIKEAQSLPVAAIFHLLSEKTGTSPEKPR